MRGWVVVTMGLALIASACHKAPQLNSEQAVQQAIEQHLRQDARLQRDNFTTEIENVSFSSDTASALVRYRSKQMPQFAVEVRYSLARAGDRWEVKSSSAVSGQGMNAHGSMPGAASAPAQNPAVPAPQSSH